MKILIFGSQGQVAWEMKRSAAIMGDVLVMGSQYASFLKPQSVVDVIREFKPQRIINASAYTAVDKAESEESTANQINAQTVGIIAEEAKKIKAHLLHYSTDYVFDGKKLSPYSETDVPNPLNAYGRSKLLGEKFIQQVQGAHTILRISWVYGSRGNNFYRTMLRLAEDRESLGVVDDQQGTPTWSRHIAEASSHIIQDPHLFEKSGIYHLSPQGETTWFGFAQKIFEHHHRLHPDKMLKIQALKSIHTKDYPTPAVRPLNSRLHSGKLRQTFALQLPHWEESLKWVVEGT